MPAVRPEGEPLDAVDGCFGGAGRLLGDRPLCYHGRIGASAVSPKCARREPCAGLSMRAIAEASAVPRIPRFP
jgi:hypothetical protein